MGAVTAKGQNEMIKAWVGVAEHSWVVKGDCWDDIKETETSPASLGKAVLWKSNCFFFASSYVKHTIFPQGRDVSSWVP